MWNAILLTTLLWHLAALDRDLAAIGGRWTGKAHILANWTSSNDLIFHLEIEPGGRVMGRIGSAALQAGRIERHRSQWIVSGALEGALLPEDGIVRKRFELRVIPVGDHLEAYGASDGHGSWPLASRASRLRGAKIQVARFPLVRE